MSGERDPHGIENYAFISGIEDAGRRARWEKYRDENDEVYRQVKEAGIAFRGWRFWPPFFCMICGAPIITNQWLFSGICGSCDNYAGCMVSWRMRRSFAGRCERIEGEESPLDIVDVTRKEGMQLAARAQQLKSAYSPLRVR